MATEQEALAAAERRVWTVPNAISAARLVLVPVFAVLIVQGQDVWAVVVLAVSGLSDWADGVIARRFDQASALGRILDPAADRAFILVTIVGLAWRGTIPWWLVAALAGREAVMGLVLLALRRRGYGPFQVHFVGKAGTFCLLYAFPLLLFGTLSGPVGAVAWTFGWAFALWGVGLYWTAAVFYIRQAWPLLRAPAPASAAGAGR